jgi:hypothetical protein
MKNPVVIIAQVRSGTTALQWALHRSHRFMNFGEIFHANNIYTNETNYFNFLINHQEVASKWLLPLADERRSCLSSYLEFLEARSGGRRPLIDVKYTMLHHYNLCWHDWFKEPFLLQLLKESGAGFIHVIRKNVVAQYFSDQIGQQIGIWHYERGRDPSQDKALTSAPRFNIAYRGLMDFVRTTMGLCGLITQFLADYDDVVTIEYETLFSEIGIKPEIVQRLNEHLGLDLTDLDCELERTPIRPRDIIANLDELADRITDPELLAMLQAVMMEGTTAGGRP